MAFDTKNKMETRVGYGNLNDRQVEDGKSAHATYLMVEYLKAIARVCKRCFKLR